MKDIQLIAKTGIGKNGKEWFAIDIVACGFRKRVFLPKWQMNAFGLLVGNIYSVVYVHPEANNE